MPRTRIPLGDHVARGAGEVCSWGQPASTHAPPSTPVTPPVTPPPATNFTFADEFNGPAGSLPDSTKWLWDVGPGSTIGGNNELETYVKSAQNTYLDGQGHLVIAVTAAGSGYNSGRIKSNFHQLFGHWEASIALQNVPGCWPAFWFLGQGSWPGCGEADCMENYGTGYADGTVWNSTATASKNGRSSGAALDGGFHTYRMDWAKGSINFYRDNILYCSATSSSLTPWPFDTNGGSYCLLNIAVGGSGTGGVHPNTALLPAKMLVDYVHCWT